jgi:glutathione S-transferase
VATGHGLAIEAAIATTEGSFSRNSAGGFWPQGRKGYPPGSGRFHRGAAPEQARLLGVLDERLAGRDWVMGADYSIADISLLGWVRNLIGFYEARELVGFDRFLHVQAWLNRGLARPAVQRGLEVTAG